jgi:ADP-ribosylglycohydrolase
MKLLKVAAAVLIAGIVRRYGPQGPTEPKGNPVLVTNDTQMMLAVGEGLLACGSDLLPAPVEAALRKAFVAWLHDPENNRAPGNTCLSACISLETHRPWQQCTVPGSKGCGANMRVQPIGLFPINPELRAALTQFQAALTHGHPTALAAADLTAATIASLRLGLQPSVLPKHLRTYTRSQRTLYHETWLGSLWQRPGEQSPLDFIARGWDECLAVLDRLDAALARPDRATDPCRQTGAGWIAEEAFATGLLCFLLFPDEPVAALRRAAVTSGDSDSIACLTGAFAGAAHGLAAWPPDWLARIEYRDRLTALGKAWD